ncbi:hypothetical protein SAMN05444673_6361 [Bacillus sp. OV166]|nr:hypothetical protein [Bacillus sp. OV166]SMQ85057.1 hypothetical protein SAMN05444673_6361 [Bacillus sp. OV166]
MENKLSFPKDEETLDFILGVYASEINMRSRFVAQAKNELDE